MAHTEKTTLPEMTRNIDSIHSVWSSLPRHPYTVNPAFPSSTLIFASSPFTDSIPKPIAISRKDRHYVLGIKLLLAVYILGLVAASSGLGSFLCVASGTVATISGVAVIPARTWTETLPWTWNLTSYLLWGCANCTYACLQWLDIPARYRRLYLFSVILLAGHFTVAISQSINSISDAATIYGPLLLTICQFLMALFYKSRHTVDQSPEGEALPLETVDITSIITNISAV